MAGFLVLVRLIAVARITWPAVGVEASAEDDQDSLLPPCRKGAIIRTLQVPQVSGPPRQALLLHGGKGAAYHETTVDEVQGGKGRRLAGKGGKGRREKEAIVFGDTWSFDLETGSWSNIASPAAMGVRWKAEGAVVNNGRDLAIFGGCSTTDASGVKDDLWVFSFESGGVGQWRLVSAGAGGADAPVKRRGHVVVANSSHLVVFGGKTYGAPDFTGNPDIVLLDLWAIPLDSLRVGGPAAKWTQGASFPGAERWGATGTVLRREDGSEVFVLFGGRANTPGYARHSLEPGAYTYHNDAWLYDFAADKWSQVQSDSLRPMRRDHHGAANIGDELFVFGGRSKETRDADSDLGDLWSLSLTTNRWIPHHKDWFAPSARYMPAVAEVNWRQKSGLAVFGGESLPGSSKKSTMNDLWVYTPGPGAGWSKLSDSHCKHTPDEPAPEDDDDYLLDDELAEFQDDLGLGPLSQDEDVVQFVAQVSLGVTLMAGLSVGAWKIMGQRAVNDPPIIDLQRPLWQ